MLWIGKSYDPEENKTIEEVAATAKANPWLAKFRPQDILCG